jgi:hypothetical protein
MKQHVQILCSKYNSKSVYFVAFVATSIYVCKSSNFKLAIPGMDGSLSNQDKLIKMLISNDLLYILLFINCNWAYARWQCLQKGYTVNKEHSTHVSRKNDTYIPRISQYNTITVA